jgi:hypothetical protein
VDRKGTFNYAIDQGHMFFAGPIPAGQYHVLVTGAQGRRATASFSVGPPPPPPATGPAALGRDRPSPSGPGHLTPSPGAQLAGRGIPVQGA